MTINYMCKSGNDFDVTLPDALLPGGSLNHIHVGWENQPSEEDQQEFETFITSEIKSRAKLGAPVVVAALPFGTPAPQFTD